MKFCSDTWFMIKLSEKDTKALEIKRSIIDGKDRLIVPSIVITELFKKFMKKGKRESDMDNFLRNLTASEKVKIIFLDEAVAREAAKVSITFNVPIVDSIIAATCKLSDCDKLLTDDSDFKILHKRKYLKVESW